MKALFIFFGLLRSILGEPMEGGDSNYYLKHCTHLVNISADVNSPVPCILDSDLEYNPDKPFKMPIHVLTQVEVNDVTSIDEKKDTFTLAIIFEYIWEDQRIGSYPNSPGAWIEIPHHLHNNIFFPDIYIHNLRELRPLKSFQRDRTESLYFKNNMFHSFQTMHVEVTCKFEYARYPFDNQMCEFLFGDMKHGNQYINFNKTVHWYQPTHARDKIDTEMDQSNTGFAVKMEALRPRLFVRQTNDPIKFSYTGLQINFMRKSGKYVANYFFPTIFYVALSWLSFTISPTQVPGRMGLLVLLYLVLLNTYFGFEEAGPENRTNGFAEAWILGCQITVLAAMFEYAIILFNIRHYTKNGKNNRFLYINARIKEDEKDELDEDEKKAKNEEHYRAMDARALVFVPLLFFIFCLCFLLAIAITA